MTSLSDIDGQPLSDLVCIHLICQACGVIDQDHKRMKKGHLCGHCRAPSEAGRLVFATNIFILVDLIQQAYHSQSPTGPLDAPQGQDVGTVIFYCTLREALLDNFLISNLRARRVDQALITRLLDDNKLAHQKFGALFTSIVGIKWKDSISELSRAQGVDFNGVSELMKGAAELRNEFLHQGRAWAMNRDFARRCVDSLGTMFEMFVSLHNQYTQPLLQGDA